MRHEIEDICLSHILRKKVLFLWSINTYNISWNKYLVRIYHAGHLEELIYQHKLIINNNRNFFTRPQSTKISIINLALITVAIRLLTAAWQPLTFCEIFEEYFSMSDHQWILLESKDLNIDCRKLKVNIGRKIQIWFKKNLFLWIAKKTGKNRVIVANIFHSWMVKLCEIWNFKNLKLFYKLDLINMPRQHASVQILKDSQMMK